MIKPIPLIPSPTRPRRGILLVEMLTAMILLSAFAVVATRLFVSSYQLSAEAAEAHDATAQADMALTRLRSDAWSATKIETKNPRTAVLAMPGAPAVTWMIEGDHLLRRTGDGDGANDDRWRISPGGETTFASDGVSVVLKVTGTKSSVGFDELCLPSQPRLIAKLTSP